MQEIKLPEDIKITPALRKLEYYEVKDELFGLIEAKRKVFETTIGRALVIDCDSIEENDRVYINGVEYTPREYD